MLKWEEMSSEEKRRIFKSYEKKIKRIFNLYTRFNEK